MRKEVSSNRLAQMLEFPLLFLGAKPSATPSFYSFMNYADFGLGTFHPKKGMYQVILAIASLAKSLGVKIKTNSPIEKILVNQLDQAYGIRSNGQNYYSDYVLSGADYHHSESLLDEKFRQYSESYWEAKTFAPSSLLFYVGFDKKLKNVNHHTLFFDVDFDVHANDLLFQAHSLHRENFDPNTVRVSTLLSNKTGSWPEDCSYCSQSARNEADLERERLLPL